METAAHVAVLVLVLLPLLGLVFPALLILVAATMLASSQPDGALVLWIGRAGAAPLAAACAIAALTGLSGILATRRSGAHTPKLRDLSGTDGEKLVQLTHDIWQQMRGPGAAPAARWFPAMDIAAYTAISAGRREVQVSAGLWRAAVAGEPAARAILAHELAHLKYGDPLVLDVLHRLGAALRITVIATAALGGCVVAFVLISETQLLLARDAGFGSIVAHWARVLAAANVVLVLLPLAWLALQRQMAFITSLIEIRADVAGAAFTNGLRQFTQLFASHERVKRSGRRELLSALLSPRLTHIPERERLAILGSPELVITPKVRFFALSLSLIFLLPINFASPLLWGGAANHLAMQATTIAFNTTLVVMLVAGQSGIGVPVSAARLVILAIASVVITALPRINLEPLSYLAMSWLSGFGGHPADWSTLTHDVAVTAGDIADRVEAGVLNIGALIAAAVSVASLLSLAATSRAAAWLPVGIRVALALALGTMGSIVAGYDDFRALRSSFAETIQSWLDGSGFGASTTLCLPLLLPALAEGLAAAVGQLAGATTRQRTTA